MKFLKTRMNRSTYWMCLGVVVALALFSAFVLEKKSGYVSEVILALVCVPRMHDIGKSGWVVAGVLFAYLIAVFSLVGALDLPSNLFASHDGDGPAHSQALMAAFHPNLPRLLSTHCGH